MICPQCKYAYKPGVFQCPDCNVALVPEETLTANAPVDPAAQTEEQGDDEIQMDDLVPVFKTGDYSLALIAQSLLQSADIPFWNKGDQLRSLTVDSWIMVKAEDEAEAREILEALDTENTGGDLDLPESGDLSE